MLIETLLQLFWHPVYLDKKYKRNDIAWMSGSVRLNKFGYRDDFNMEILKETDTYRFYFLGDSYTYGWYIDDVSNSYPKLFEKNLKEKYPEKKIEVINAARPGFDFEAEKSRLLNEGIAFKPDYIFFGINIDDLVDKEFPPRFSKSQFIRNSKLYQFTIGNYKRVRSAQQNEKATKESMSQGFSSNEKALENFEKVNELSKQIGAKTVLIIFPRYNPANPNEEYRYSFYHDFYNQIGEKYSFEIIDLIEPFSEVSNKKELVLNPTDPHPSIQANKITANYLIERLDLSKMFSKKPTEQKVTTKQVRENEKLGDIIRLIDTDSGWNIKQTEENIPIQSLFLNSLEKEIPYYEDKIVGIDKVEKYIKGGKEIVLDSKIYDYDVDRITHVTGYWREEGALNSIDLSLENLNIQKKQDSIVFRNPLSQDFEMYKIVFLVEAKKIEIVDGLIIDLDETDVFPTISYIEI